MESESTQKTDESAARRSRQDVVRSRRIAQIAQVIRNHVGYFNGWKVSDEVEQRDCENAAKEAIARIERWKRPNEIRSATNPRP